MDGDVVDLLRWINEVRSIRGMELLHVMPKGVPCDPSRCPVARALEADITFDGLALSRDRAWPPVHLPPVARRFAGDFDVGLHPGLEEAGTGSCTPREGAQEPLLA